jgi:hypothetical protein
MVLVNLAGNDTARKQAIEGPTRAQAKRMALAAREMRAKSATLAAQGRDAAAFNVDCDVMDIENDLYLFGFDPRTGLKSRTR